MGSESDNEVSPITETSEHLHQHKHLGPEATPLKYVRIIECYKFDGMFFFFCSLSLRDFTNMASKRKAQHRNQDKKPDDDGDQEVQSPPQVSVFL